MDERRDDWRQGVDENLASLNAGQRVWEREMTVIRKLLGEFDRLLRGDIEKDTDGAIARLHQQETEINLLKAVVLKDKAGNKGLIGRIEDLESGERRSETRLKLYIALIGLLSALAVGALTNMDKIGAFFGSKTPDPLDQMIDRTKNPPRKHLKIRIKDDEIQRIERSDN